MRRQRRWQLRRQRQKWASVRRGECGGRVRGKAAVRVHLPLGSELGEPG